MQAKPVLRALASLALASLTSLTALAADAWPTKPITLVVPFPAGGGTDVVARAIGQQLSQSLKVPVVVDNKPGAATAIGAEIVKRAPADGYTLLVSGASTFSINPAIRGNLRYDPIKDFEHLGIVATVPLLLTVNADSPFRDVNAIVAAAKAKPGALNYATHGTGSAPHLAASLFSLAAGIQMTEVGYRGSSPALVAVLASEVDLALDTAAAVGAQIKAGKLRALANFGSQRSSHVPTVPTMNELQLPGATFEGWYGMAAPAGTPPAVVQRLSKAIMAAMKAPAVLSQLAAQSIDPAQIPAAGMRAQVDGELARYRALAVRAGIRLE